MAHYWSRPSIDSSRGRINVFLQLHVIVFRFSVSVAYSHSCLFFWYFNRGIDGVVCIVSTVVLAYLLYRIGS